MKLKVMTIPASGCEMAEENINKFLGSKRIIQVDRQLIQSGSGSFWSLCIGYDDNSGEHSTIGGRSRVDYRQVLDPNAFREYSALREWRKSVAQTEGVAVFTVFNNDQLAKIAQMEDLSKSALLSIEGVGQAKVEKYSDELIQFINDRRGRNE